MKWWTVVLVSLLATLVIALAVLFAIMFSNRPTELGELSGEPGFGELRLGHSQGPSAPSLDVPTNMSAYEMQLSNMSEPELQGELLRMIQSEYAAATTAVQGDGEDRAVRLLTSIASTSRVVGDDENLNAGEGRGIVVCAGGFVYGTCAFVLLGVMRSQGCTLPVEVWHRNDEMSDEMADAYRELGADVRNIDQVASVDIGSRYAIKPLAVFYSKFQQVLLLDADNVTAADPTPLFDMLSSEVPAVFWPDHWHLERSAPCWNVLSEEQAAHVNYGFCQESGQLLVDKRYCTRALGLCCKINLQLHSQLGRLFPKPFNEGDKDTWHFSWLVTDTPFTMISHRAGGAGARDESGQYIGCSILQYDAQGEPLFVHKCWAKWATQTNRPQWTTAVRFHSKARGRVDQWTHRFEDGPVVRELFYETFGDLEEQCWEKLEDLRKQEWYKSQFSKQMSDL